MVDGIFRFNKGENVKLTNFNGVSKEELSNRKDVSDNQKKLVDSIFKQYDKNNDGILSKEEYVKMAEDLQKVARNDNLSERELKKFNKNYLGVDKKSYEMNDLQKVMTMMTDDSDSVTNVEKRVDSDAIEVTYKPNQYGSVKTEVLRPKQGGGTVLLSEETKNADGTVTKIFYKDGDRSKKSSMIEIKQDENIETIYNDDGSYSVRHYTKNGSYTVTTQNYDKNGNLIPDVESSQQKQSEPVETKTPKTTEYQVQSGEFWYNIVAAKYGVKDHKTIINIVHQLKDAAGVDYKSSKMPSKIDLPNEITIGKNKYTLINVTSSGNECCNDLPTILPIEKNIHTAKSILGMPTQDRNNANKTVKGTTAENSEKFFKYDRNGELTCIYSDEAHKNADQPSFSFAYDKHGNVEIYTKYDSNGNKIDDYWFIENGNLYTRLVYDSYPEDATNSKCPGRVIECDADGNIKKIRIMHYNEAGECQSYEDFDSDGNPR